MNIPRLPIVFESSLGGLGTWFVTKDREQALSKAEAAYRRASCASCGGEFWGGLDCVGALRQIEGTHTYTIRYAYFIISLSLSLFLSLCIYRYIYNIHVYIGVYIYIYDYTCICIYVRIHIFVNYYDVAVLPQWNDAS